MSRPDAVIIICSRTQSRRIPRKVFKRIAGVTALDHILHRITPSHYPIVLAVPEYMAKVYQAHLEYELTDRLIFEGNPESPLHRMAEVLESMTPMPKWTVRITHDDILIDNKTMCDMIEWVDKHDYNYAISPTIVEGAGVEIIRSQKIINAANERKDPTEFVSYFVNDEGVHEFKPRKAICRNYRLTMDYPKDAIVLEILLRELGPFAELDQICAFIDEHRSIMDINRLPDISFYTCVHNSKEYIVEAISSVITSGLDYEYIIVDDKSDDGTLTEIAKFASHEKMDLILNDKNMGLASSSNIALSHAKGKMVMRLDADDVLFVNSIRYIAEMFDMIKKPNGYNIVYPSYIEMNEQGQLTSLNKDPKEAHHAGCALMEKKFIDEMRFKDGIRYWDSKELYNRVSKLRVGYYKRPTWIYRRRKKSLSTNGEDRSKAHFDIFGHVHKE